MALRVDWCSHEAARFAVEHWHYSRKLPASKTNAVGVWEDDAYIGAVVFGWGPNPNLCKMLGVSMAEVVELQRVALRAHRATVTSIVAKAIQLLRSRYPQLRAIASYADPAQGHIGIIYQAGNWLYLGRSPNKQSLQLPDGSTREKRAYTGRNFNAAARPIPPGSRWVAVEGRHRYFMPLDRSMKRRLLPLAQPYPKRVAA